MKTISAAAVAIVLALSTASPSAVADGLGGNSPAKLTEKIGSAAPGKPKPYFARALSDCGIGSQCIFNFGKKNNKTRNISWINCGIRTSDGVVYRGIIAIDDIFNQLGYMTEVSRAIAGGMIEYTVLEYKNPVTIAEGETFMVISQASGTSDGDQCTLGGTIE